MRQGIANRLNRCGAEDLRLPQMVAHREKERRRTKSEAFYIDVKLAHVNGIALFPGLVP